MSEKTVRAANGVVSIFAGCLMAVLFLYGGYSLWDTWRIYHGAFVDDELMELKPVRCLWKLCPVRIYFPEQCQSTGFYRSL